MVTAEQLAEAERWIVRNGMGIQVMETLAVGAILTALALELGASNVTIGALAAIPHFSQLAQIPALVTVERLRRRQRIYLISGAIARPMLLLIAVAPLLADTDVALGLIFGAFAVRYAAGAFLSCSWNSWMRDLVPDEQMGRLFSTRQRRMIGVAIAGSLAAAAFIDAWHRYVPWPAPYAYSLVYLLAFVGGAYSVWCAKRILEPPMAPAAPHSHWERLREPFRHENYRRLIGFLASWNFAINLAAPFFTVLMLQGMQLDLLWVIGLGTLSQLAAYFMVSQWGVIADRFSNKSVLRVGVPLFLISIFAWTFTTMPDPHPLTAPLLIAIHIATGIASAGVTLASGNITLKLAPHGNATAYLAASSMVNAAAAGIAAVLGGLTADLFASWELSLTVHWQTADSALDLKALSFSHWDFFFFFATVIGLYSLHRLSLVEEQGEVGETIVVDALLNQARRGLRNLSTVAGLRAATEFPVGLLDVAEDDRADVAVEQEATPIASETRGRR